MILKQHRLHGIGSRISLGEKAWLGNSIYSELHFAYDSLKLYQKQLPIKYMS